MYTFVADAGTEVTVPPWVKNINSFRRWTDSEDYPSDLNTWWLCGEVWIDMSKEQIFTHLDVKGEIYSVLKRIVRESRSGRILPDGLLLTNFAADISGNPDATYISNESFEAERVRLIEGKGDRDGYVEVQGSPDMVLEVVSNSSVRKDTVVLRDAYWSAGVKEYWLADARVDPVSFDILRHTARGFVTARKHDGWVRSSVFGKQFRLVQHLDENGHPEFVLEVR